MFPPIFNCYGVQLGQRNLLPIQVDPVIADYHRRRSQTAQLVLDSHLADCNYLCAAEPTIADLFCYGDIAFAEISAFELERWTNVARRAARIAALPAFQAPFELLAMQDAELS